MTNKEKEIERKVEEHTKVSMYAYDKGFQEGKTQTLEKIKELVDNWASRSVLTFDDDSIKQIKLKDDICKYVKELKELLSSLDNKEVTE